MNPKTWTNDNRRVVWTVSQTNPDTYCLYVQGILVGENLPFDTFYSLYRNAVEANH